MHCSNPKFEESDGSPKFKIMKYTPKIRKVCDIHSTLLLCLPKSQTRAGHSDKSPGFPPNTANS